MRFSIVAAIATLSATVVGQGNLANIPTCAQSCFSTDNLGSCKLTDVACVCGSSAITQVACCVLSSCSQNDIQTTISFAETLCRGAGVTLNTSPDCGAANSSASASSSASAAASGSASSSASVTAISGTNSASASRSATASGTSASGSAAATAATGAAAFQTAGPVVGLGVAVIGMLAAL